MLSILSRQYADSTASSDTTGSRRDYLPIQNRLKITPSKSSGVNSPGNAGQLVLRQPQLFGEQVERLVVLRRMLAAISRCSRAARSAIRWRSRAR
jgi:hypothetical protein